MHACPVRPRAVARSGQLARPAEHGRHPQHQLPRAERLGHVVVGAQLEAENAIFLLAERGEHHDGQLGRLTAEPPADLQTTEAGQHQVEDHDVGGTPGHRLQRLLTVAGHLDQVARAVQVARHHVPHRHVVVDDQGERPFGHRSPRTVRG
jgi:hypothetical protein